jgi:hypothetical protein
MENNKPENVTANQQNDDQQAQLADLPVEETQEIGVRGGQFFSVTLYPPEQGAHVTLWGHAFELPHKHFPALTDEEKRQASNE